ncbi:MAG: YggS family pyridoxal phosphate-dependent enzyme [Deinococcaceae bacterium]
MSLSSVRDQISQAARNAGRDPTSVTLLAVSKGQSVQDIQGCVLAHGRYPLGESRGQELRDKRVQLPPDTEWHFIGPIQKNKIKYLKGVQLIHTLENLEIATELARHGEQWGEVPRVLIQVHNDEPQKHGVAPEHVGTLRKQIETLGLCVAGLMVMAPKMEHKEDENRIKKIFSDTAELQRALDLPMLSMGMSDDFECAIGCGSTLVRIGGAIFK